MTSGLTRKARGGQWKQIRHLAALSRCSGQKGDNLQAGPIGHAQLSQVQVDGKTPGNGRPSGRAARRPYRWCTTIVLLLLIFTLMIGHCVSAEATSSLFTIDTACPREESEDPVSYETSLAFESTIPLIDAQHQLALALLGGPGALQFLPGTALYQLFGVVPEQIALGRREERRLRVRQGQLLYGYGEVAFHNCIVRSHGSFDLTTSDPRFKAVFEQDFLMTEEQYSYKEHTLGWSLPLEKQAEKNLEVYGGVSFFEGVQYRKRAVSLSQSGGYERDTGRFRIAAKGLIANDWVLCPGDGRGYGFFAGTELNWHDRLIASCQLEHLAAGITWTDGVRQSWRIDTGDQFLVDSAPPRSIGTLRQQKGPIHLPLSPRLTITARYLSCSVFGEVSWKHQAGAQPRFQAWVGTPPAGWQIGIALPGLLCGLKIMASGLQVRVMFDRPDARATKAGISVSYGW